MYMIYGDMDDATTEVLPMSTVSSRLERLRTARLGTTSEVAPRAGVPLGKDLEGIVPVSSHRFENMCVLVGGSKEWSCGHENRRPEGSNNLRLASPETAFSESEEKDVFR